MKNQIESSTKRLHEARAVPSATSHSAAPSTTTSPSRALDMENLWVLGGFWNDTPRGVLEHAWTTCLNQQFVIAGIDVSCLDVFCPYLLS